MALLLPENGNERNQGESANTIFPGERAAFSLADLNRDE
jgi:hypothetical protein